MIKKRWRRLTSTINHTGLEMPSRLLKSPAQALARLIVRIARFPPPKIVMTPDAQLINFFNEMIRINRPRAQFSVPFSDAARRGTMHASSQLPVRWSRRRAVEPCRAEISHAVSLTKGLVVMPTKTKTANRHNGPATAERKASETQPAADWVKQMMSGLIEVQQRWLEIAVEQNALILRGITEGLKVDETASWPGLADWARQSIDAIVVAQKRWADIISEQSAQFFEAIREDAGFDVNECARAMSDYAEQSAEAIVKARTRWLDFVAQQNAQTTCALKEGLSVEALSPAAAIVDFAQQAVTRHVEVQKQWLDLATQLPFLKPANEKR